MSLRRRFRHSPSIQDVFRRYFLSFTLGPLILLGLYLGWQFYAALERTAMRTIEADRHIASNLAEEFFRESMDRLDLLSKRTTVRALFGEYAKNSGDEGSILAGLEREFKLFALEPDSHVMELLVFDGATGDCIMDMVFRPELSADSVGKNFREERLFEYGKTGSYNPPLAFDRRLSQVALSQSTPVVLPSGRSFVIAQHVDAVGWLKRTRKLFEKSWNTSIAIFTIDGRNLEWSESQSATVRESFAYSQAIERARLGETDSARYWNHTGVLVLGSFTVLSGKQAIVVAELPLAAFVEEMKSTAIILGPPLLVLFLSIFILTALQARRFSRPLIQLVARCREIAEGDWERMVAISGVMELELLGNSFNAMARDLSTSFKERESINRSLEEANRLLTKKNEELYESETKYRDLYENSLDGLYTFDPDTGKYIMYNRKFCEITGYSFEELGGISVDDIVPPEERAYADEQRELRRRGQKLDSPYELYIKRKDGTYIYVEVYSRPIPGSHCFAGSVRDVTERVKLEKDIIEKNQQLEKLNESLETLVQERTRTLIALKELHEKIIANAPVGLMVVDTELAVTFANDLILKLCAPGRMAAEILGRPLDTEHPILPDRAFEKLADCLRGESFYSEEIKFTPEGEEGASYLDIWGVPLVGENEEIEGALVIAADRTRQVQIREELVKNRRLAATGQLAASLAHEINNPLNSIRYNLELAEMDLEDFAEKHAQNGIGAIEEYLHTVNREIDRIGDIVRNLLDLHRSSRLSPIPLDLNAVINDVLVLMRKQILEQGAKVVFEPKHGLPDINGLSGPIKQIVINMITNSLQSFDEKPGRIDIATGSEGDFGYFVVSDDGCGIPPEVLPRIFEPFFSTKGLSGVGLGLAICESIVNQFGGRIEVESEVGQGTRFAVYLPLYKDDGK
ncbi:MAG: PAS domain S-box protein [bacterium]